MSQRRSFQSTSYLPVHRQCQRPTYPSTGSASVLSSLHLTSPSCPMEPEARLSKPLPSFAQLQALPNTPSSLRSCTTGAANYPTTPTPVSTNPLPTPSITACPIPFHTLPYITSTLSLIHLSEPTRLRRISYAVYCLNQKHTKLHIPNSPIRNYKQRI